MCIAMPWPFVALLLLGIQCTYGANTINKPQTPCDCYVTDNGDLFSNYSFLDFRGLSNPNSEPANVTTSQLNA